MTIVVTGATGNVGRPLLADLVAAGAQARAVPRAPDTAGLPSGVEAVGSAADALPGASAVFLNSRALGDDLPAVVAQCADAGVTKLVALSAINAADDFSRQPSRFRGDRNKEVEQLAVESGLAWVSLRPAVFATNFAGMWAAQIRAGDVVAGPYAAASQAPIVESDISAVAARALLTGDLVGQRFPSTSTCSPRRRQEAEMSDPRPPRYLKPMNKVMMAVQRLGIPTGPAMVLTVPGRKSGQPRSTPMTPFEFDGGLYVVAGYPGADWAANARAAGTGRLSRGRRSREVRIVELDAEEARPVLRAFSTEVPVGVAFAKRSGMVREGTADEFEALAS